MLAVPEDAERVLKTPDGDELSPNVEVAEMDATKFHPEIAELPRYEDPNVMGYTKLEKAEKLRCVKELEKMFPNLPWKWLDYIYDYHFLQDKTELEKRIEAGEFEKKSVFRVPQSDP